MGYLQINLSTNQQINFYYDDFRIIAKYMVFSKGYPPLLVCYE